MREDKSAEIIMYIFGAFIVIWFALLIAPYLDGGILNVIKEISVIMDNPFNIKFCENSVKTILFLLLIYILAIGTYNSTKKNYRRLEEHGSAKWGNVFQIAKKYVQKPITENKILTQNAKLGLNAKRHRRNLNILVCRR